MNESVNKTTKEPPLKIWEHIAKSQQEIKTDKPVDKFLVGDFVRIKNANENFKKSSTGIFSNKVYRIKEIDGLGLILDGYNKNVFPVDVKKVSQKESNDKIDELRQKNIKKNTIKRRLNKELN